MPANSATPLKSPTLKRPKTTDRANQSRVKGRSLGASLPSTGLHGGGRNRGKNSLSRPGTSAGFNSNKNDFDDEEDEQAAFRPKSALGSFSSSAFFRTNAAKAVWSVERGRPPPSGVLPELLNKEGEAGGFGLSTMNASRRQVLIISDDSSDEEGMPKPNVDEGGADAASVAAAARDTTALPLSELKAQVASQNARLKTLANSIKKNNVQQRRAAKEQRLRKQVLNSQETLSKLLQKRRALETQVVALEDKLVQVTHEGNVEKSEDSRRKNLETRLGRLEEKMFDEIQYGETLSYMKLRNDSQRVSQNASIDKVTKEIENFSHDIKVLRKQCEEAQLQADQLEAYVRNYAKLSKAEAKAHAIQLRQRRKQHEKMLDLAARRATAMKAQGAEALKAANAKISQDMLSMMQSNVDNSGGQTTPIVEGYSKEQCEEAIRKLFAVTGEADVQSVIAKFSQRDSNVAVWKSIAQDTEKHFEELVTQKARLQRDLQHRFAAKEGSEDSQNPSISPSRHEAEAVSALDDEVQIEPGQTAMEAALKNLKIKVEDADKRLQVAEMQNSRLQQLLVAAKAGMAQISLKVSSLQNDPVLMKKMQSAASSISSKLFAKGVNVENRAKAELEIGIEDSGQGGLSTPSRGKEGKSEDAGGEDNNSDDSGSVFSLEDDRAENSLADLLATHEKMLTTALQIIQSEAPELHALLIFNSQQSAVPGGVQGEEATSTPRSPTSITGTSSSARPIPAPSMFSSVAQQVQYHLDSPGAAADDTVLQDLPENIDFVTDLDHLSSIANQGDGIANNVRVELASDAEDSDDALDDGAGMDSRFMDSRRAFKEAAERKARVEQRKRAKKDGSA